MRFDAFEAFRQWRQPGQARANDLEARLGGDAARVLENAFDEAVAAVGKTQNVRHNRILLRVDASIWHPPMVPKKRDGRSDHSLTFQSVVQILRSNKTIKISRQQRLATREETR
jgi:hypothetical protein